MQMASEETTSDYLPTSRQVSFSGSIFFFFNMVQRIVEDASNVSKRIEGTQMSDDPSAPKKFNPFIFLPPALCDMTATSIQEINSPVINPTPLLHFT
jgi:hypothetical protein